MTCYLCVYEGINVLNFSMVTNLVYKLLENPIIVYVKAKETRTAIFNIVGVMVKRYNHGLSKSIFINQ